MRGDFHIHTTYSDGRLSVEEILALTDDLDFFSITDHDCLTGSLKAVQLTKKAIIGVELSTEHLGESVHILGYFSNPSGLKELDDKLEAQRNHRFERAFKIRDRLKAHFGFELKMDFVTTVDSITRGTIATEIIKQGFPYTREYIFKNMIGRGNPAYIPSTKIKTAEGINLLHQFGGLAILAHPTLLIQTNPRDIIAMGADGLEAIYSKNQIGHQEMFIQMAKEYGLLITAGSDFHFPDDQKHGSIGSVSLQGSHLNDFLGKLRKGNQ
jgi:hypothetical protein